MSVEDMVSIAMDFFVLQFAVLARSHFLTWYLAMFSATICATATSKLVAHILAFAIVLLKVSGEALS